VPTRLGEVIATPAQIDSAELASSDVFESLRELSVEELKQLYVPSKYRRLWESLIVMRQIMGA